MSGGGGPGNVGITPPLVQFEARSGTEIGRSNYNFSRNKKIFCFIGRSFTRLMVFLMNPMVYPYP